MRRGWIGPAAMALVLGLLPPLLDGSAASSWRGAAIEVPGNRPARAGTVGALGVVPLRLRGGGGNFPSGKIRPSSKGRQQGKSGGSRKAATPQQGGGQWKKGHLKQVPGGGEKSSGRERVAASEGGKMISLEGAARMAPPINEEDDHAGLTLTPSRTHSHTLSHSLSHPLALTLTPSRTHSHTLSHSLPHPLALTLTPCRTHSSTGGVGEAER